MRKGASFLFMRGLPVRKLYKMHKIRFYFQKMATLFIKEFDNNVDKNRKAVIIINVVFFATGKYW